MRKGEKEKDASLGKKKKNTFIWKA